MPFTRALFYPWIDIRNDGWLKNALLYWEEISTIVPASFGPNPYSGAASEFCRLGVLRPHFVSNRDDTAKVLPSIEDVYRFVGQPGLVGRVRGSPREGDSGPGFTCPIRDEKLLSEVANYLLHSGTAELRGEWYRVPKEFGDFYMTLLATNIAEANGLGLLTSGPLQEAVSSRIRLGIGDWQARHLLAAGRDYLQEDERRDAAARQGVMVSLVTEGVEIDRGTPPGKIMEFREKYSHERRKFASAVSELVSTVPRHLSGKAEWQALNDICDAGVRPAVQDLKDSLRGLGIRCAAKDYVKTLFFSSVPTAATMFLGLSAPVALAAGAGISLVASLVNYREDRNDTLRRNPYSYLLAVEGEFRSKRK